MSPRKEVYHVTANFYKASVGRVFNTLLDEQTFWRRHRCWPPRLRFDPKIQYLAYLHNAEDQLRGEAASLSFFSKGQYTNPMVVRIILRLPKGFGGHFHNNNSLLFCETSGLIIASPLAQTTQSHASGYVAAAKVNGRVSAFWSPSPST